MWCTKWTDDRVVLIFSSGLWKNWISLNVNPELNPVSDSAAGHSELVLDVWPEFFSLRSLFTFCTIAYHLFALMNSCLIEVLKPHWPRKRRKSLSFFAMRNIHHQPLIQRWRSLSYSDGIIKPTLVCVWRPHPPHGGLLTSETPNSWDVSSPGDLHPLTDF